MTDGKWRPRIDVDPDNGTMWLDGCELDIDPADIDIISIDDSEPAGDPRITVRFAIRYQPGGYLFSRRRPHARRS